MKRDMELVRQILFALEEHDKPGDWCIVTIEGRSAIEISYHVKLLNDAGYLEAEDISTSDGFAWRPTSLTWQGHEFLDAVRNDTVWNNTKKAVADKGGSIPFELLKELAIGFARAHFGL